MTPWVCSTEKYFCRVTRISIEGGKSTFKIFHRNSNDCKRIIIRIRALNYSSSGSLKRVLFIPVRRVEYKQRQSTNLLKVHNLSDADVLTTSPYIIDSEHATASCACTLTKLDFINMFLFHQQTNVALCPNFHSMVMVNENVIKYRDDFCRGH